MIKDGPTRVIKVHRLARTNVPEVGGLFTEVGVT